MRGEWLLRGLVSRWEGRLDSRVRQGQDVRPGRGSRVSGAAALGVHLVRSLVSGNVAEILQADRTEGPARVACGEPARPRLFCDLTGQRRQNVAKGARGQVGETNPQAGEVCIGVEVGRVG